MFSVHVNNIGIVQPHSQPCSWTKSGNKTRYCGAEVIINSHASLIVLKIVCYIWTCNHAISVSDLVCIITSVIFGYGLTNLKASRWKLHRAIKHWVPIAFCSHSTLLLSLVVLLKHLYFLKLDYRGSVRRTESCLKEEFFTLFTAISQVSTCYLCAWRPCMGVHWAMALIGAAK